MEIHGNRGKPRIVKHNSEEDISKLQEAIGTIIFFIFQLKEIVV